MREQWILGGGLLVLFLFSIFLVGPQVYIYFEFCYVFFSSFSVFSKVKKRKESFRLVFEFDAKATFHFWAVSDFRIMHRVIGWVVGLLCFLLLGPK